MTRRPTHPRRALTFGLALVASVALLTTACGAAQSVFRSANNAPAPDSAQSPPAATSAPAALAQPGPGRADRAQPAPAQPAASPPSGQPAQALAGQTSSDVPASTLPLDRMVVRSAKLSVQVGDVEQALARTREIAQASGGFLSASNTRLERVDGQDRTVADLTLQVRGETLDGTLQALRGLGKVESETSSSQDVTEEYVDLDANLRNLQASESAILKLVDRAQRIEDVITLQRELTNVRGQIERIQGRKKYLERRTDMATVTLSLHLPPVENGSTIAGGGWDPVAIARRGWTASLGMLRGAAEIVIVAAAFSWWLIPLVALGAYVWLHRRPRPRASEV